MRSFAFTLSWLVCANAWASSNVRYALVVGNNHGETPGRSLPELRHAEREARELSTQLIGRGNLAQERVVVVTGGTRADILAGARRLAETRNADRTLLGDLPTLFAFFFTGHGVAGELLTVDQPLNGEDLAQIFREMDASLSVGFFDACFSGSLDDDTLFSKGARPTGFNPIAELPKEVLNSEGTVWLVSSRPNELSYEDSRLGGVFTHYFIESFDRAPSDAIGIRFDDMWEYARRRTQEHTQARGKSQTPEKIIRKMKSRAPLYFSFPNERSARVRFTSEVSGSYLLQHEHGALTERIEKKPGVPLEVSTYPGAILVARLDARGTARPAKRISLEPQGTVEIARSQDVPSAPLGYFNQEISAKGEWPSVRIGRVGRELDGLIGGSYAFSSVSSSRVGVPHSGGASLTLIYGEFEFGADAYLGESQRNFDVWSVDIRAAELGARLGYGLELGRFRWVLEGVGRVSRANLDYGEETRTATGGFVGIGTRFRIPIPARDPWFTVSPWTQLGMRFSEGIAFLDTSLESEWGLTAGAEVSLAF